MGQRDSPGPLYSEDEEEVQKQLDAVIDGMKSTLPIEPYVASVPSSHPYKVPLLQHDDWRRGVRRLFSMDEERLQYQTFRYRDPLKNSMMKLEPVSAITDNESGSGQKQKKDSSPFQGPKIKMTLSEYKNKKKNLPTDARSSDNTKDHTKSKVDVLQRDSNSAARSEKLQVTNTESRAEPSEIMQREIQKGLADTETSQEHETQNDQPAFFEAAKSAFVETTPSATDIFPSWLKPSPGSKPASTASPASAFDDALPSSLPSSFSRQQSPDEPEARVGSRKISSNASSRASAAIGPQAAQTGSKLPNPHRDSIAPQVKRIERKAPMTPTLGQISQRVGGKSPVPRASVSERREPKAATTNAKRGREEVNTSHSQTPKRARLSPNASPRETADSTSAKKARGSETNGGSVNSRKALLEEDHRPKGHSRRCAMAKKLQSDHKASLKSAASQTDKTRATQHNHLAALKGLASLLAYIASYTERDSPDSSIKNWTDVSTFCDTIKELCNVTQELEGMWHLARQTIYAQMSIVTSRSIPKADHQQGSLGDQSLRSLSLYIVRAERSGTAANNRLCRVTSKTMPQTHATMRSLPPFTTPASVVKLGETFLNEWAAVQKLQWKWKLDDETT